MIRLAGWMLILMTGAAALADEPQAQTQPAAGDAAKGPADMYPRVKLETSLGNIVVELNGEKAPISTQNFLAYVEKKHYDGLIFHRVIKTFMIQGGGYTAEMEERREGLLPPIRNEWKNGLKNGKYTIAMARTSEADSATAQFFINVTDNTMLDQARPQGGNAAYAVFGKVVEGTEVVDKIRDVPTGSHPKMPGSERENAVPTEPVIIKSVTVVSAYNKEKIAAAVADAADGGLKKRIAQIETETGKKFEKSASGLMWVVVKEGAGASPKATDTIEVHYRCMLPDGTEIDSSYKGNQPAVFPLNQMIKGWIEGLQTMKPGEKRFFVIPPDLAWGRRGSPPKIPPNATVVFEVELISVK